MSSSSPTPYPKSPAAGSGPPTEGAQLRCHHLRHGFDVEAAWKAPRCRRERKSRFAISGAMRADRHLGSSVADFPNLFMDDGGRPPPRPQRIIYMLESPDRPHCQRDGSCHESSVRRSFKARRQQAFSTRSGAMRGSARTKAAATAGISPRGPQLTLGGHSSPIGRRPRRQAQGLQTAPSGPTGGS